MRLKTESVVVGSFLTQYNTLCDFLQPNYSESECGLYIVVVKCRTFVGSTPDGGANSMNTQINNKYLWITQTKFAWVRIETTICKATSLATTSHMQSKLYPYARSCCLLPLSLPDVGLNVLIRIIVAPTPYPLGYRCNWFVPIRKYIPNYSRLHKPIARVVTDYKYAVSPPYRTIGVVRAN